MPPVRVRFAPSPTGYLHVGGARTALFNWLFARRQGGVYILRIEDTDADRSRPELTEAVIEGLRWLGLDWDEGPYHQSERLESYRALAARLEKSGHAYPCFCTPGELDLRRKTAEKSGKPWKYDGRCRALTAAEVAARRAGQSHAIRFRVPASGETRYHDLVFGEMVVAHNEIDDFVLLRSDRLPTYHLGVVADDLEMRITHVIRGADHLSNTPKQLLMYQALGETPPIFAHVPLILGPDKTRLSKRHGATSVTTYRDEGFLPEAFRNFLALLGWSPGDDRELMPTEELVQRFSLEQVSRTNAVFDRSKLEWFNAEYLRSEPLEKILPRVEGELRRAGLWREDWNAAGREWFARAVDLLRPRARLLTDFSTWARAFFTDEFERDPQAIAKFAHDKRLRDLWLPLYERLREIKNENWTHDEIEKAVRGVAEQAGVKAAVLINATRVAVTGQAVAPPLFDTLELLEQQRVVSRVSPYAVVEILGHENVLTRLKEMERRTGAPSVSPPRTVVQATWDEPPLPTLWLDTSIGIKLAKIEREEGLQEIELTKCKQLKRLVTDLVQKMKLLCPEADQEEEFEAERLEREVSAEFNKLSAGLRLRHRQGVLDSQVQYAMKAYCTRSAIHLPVDIYFHGDPVKKLQETLNRGMSFDIKLGPWPELVARRNAGKRQVVDTTEKLRQKLVDEGQTYEQQLQLELKAYADTMLKMLGDFKRKTDEGTLDFWDVLGVSGFGAYLVFWKDLGGEPPGLPGLYQFFSSEYFFSLPICKIRSQLYADLMTGNQPIKSGDTMDVEMLSVALPLANYVLTDKSMESRIKRRGIDKDWKAKVYSMSTIDGLLGELDRLALAVTQ